MFMSFTFLTGCSLYELDLPSSTTVNGVRLPSLQIAQSLVFRCSNKKYTWTLLGQRGQVSQVLWPLWLFILQLSSLLEVLNPESWNQVLTHDPSRLLS